MAAFTKTLNDGHTIPWLAFGTGTALARSDVTHPVSLALSNGITHLDGAQAYQNEQFLGEAIAAHLSSTPRDRLFVTTKVFELKDEEGRRTVRETLIESLKKLRVEYVDLFLLHTPSTFFEEGKLEAAWAEMEALKGDGLAKSIGVSNFRVQDLERLLKVAKVVPAVNQIEYHPYVVKAAKPILDLGRARGIYTASYGGLAPIFRETGGPLDPVLESIRQRLESSRADGKGVTAGQVLLKWLWQSDVLAITTSSKDERIKEYIDSANVPDLTPDEIKAINDAGAQHHYRRFWMKDGKSFMDE